MTIIFVSSVMKETLLDKLKVTIAKFSPGIFL